MTVAEVQSFKERLIELPKGALLPSETTNSNELRAYMQSLGWFTFKFHGNEFQSGWPDLWASHIAHGNRLIETKSHRKGHKLETTQVKIFTALRATGVGIWVLQDSTDYKKLFSPPNWTDFL